MKRSILLAPLAAVALLAGCAAQTPEMAAAAAKVCQLHADPATVAAVNDVTGIDPKLAAEKKLALDIYCATQLPPK